MEHKNQYIPFLNIKTFVIFMIGLAISMLSVVVLMPSNTQAQSPADCTAGAARPYIGYNRKAWCGFFHNEGWTAGPPLRGGSWNPDGTWTEATAANPGIPDDLDTAQEFVDMVLNDLHNGDARAVTAAQFIVLSMLGVQPAQEGTVDKVVTSEQIAEWQARVLSYADIDDNTSGSGISTGQNGTINWNAMRHLDCGETNTYYQIEFDDVAPFEVNTTNTPDCNDPDFLERYVVFTSTSGTDLLQIRALCMNPAGEIAPLEAAAAVEEDGTIGDQIFEDANNNGVFDEGDTGISGVTVAIYASTQSCQQGELIATTTTDVNGNYQFTNLPVISDEGAFAKYIVVVTDDANVLEGYTVTSGAAGVDGNSQDPYGYCATLTFDARSNQTADFGYYVGATLAETGNSHTILAVSAGISVAGGAGLLVLRRKLSSMTS